MFSFSLWRRLVEWAKFSFTEEEKLSYQEKVLRSLNPGNPEEIEVDWVQAPDDAIEWVFDPSSAAHGRWLNGKKTYEEYGIVHDWSWAPSFGATQKARVKITPSDITLQNAHKLSMSTQAASTESLASPRRL